MTDEIIVEGRGLDQRTSWRVRHTGEHYYVERGRVRRHRMEWFALAHFQSRERALEVFAGYARPARPPSSELPPNLDLPLH
jgi:hypothetical protein